MQAELWMMNKSVHSSGYDSVTSRQKFQDSSMVEVGTCKHHPLETDAVQWELMCMRFEV
jgi:hypothetical protein